MNNAVNPRRERAERTRRSTRSTESTDMSPFASVINVLNILYCSILDALRSRDAAALETLLNNSIPQTPEAKSLASLVRFMAGKNWSEFANYLGRTRRLCLFLWVSPSWLFGKKYNVRIVINDKYSVEFFKKRETPPVLANPIIERLVDDISVNEDVVDK